jgi:hypothetical protein
MKGTLSVAALWLSLPLVALAPSAYQKAWVCQTSDWNKGVAVAASGDVVSLSSGRLLVHAGDTGQVLETVPVGYVLSGAWGPVGNRWVLVAEDQILEVALPGGAKKALAKLDSRAAVACVSPFGAAVADEKGSIRTFTAQGWTVADSFEAGASVEGLALSGGGRAAAELADGTVLLRDPAAKTTATLLKGDGSGSKAIAFSADGRRLFAASGIFKAFLWDVAKGNLLAEYRTGSWLTSVRFLGADAVAAGGSDGLVIYTKPGEPSQKLTYAQGSLSPSVEGVGASTDGTLVCCGDRDGAVACFSTGPLKPSEYKPSTGHKEGQAAVSGATAPPVQEDVTGTLVSRTGSSLTVKLDHPPAPPLKARATLFKYFEKEIGGFKTSGWLEIAAVEVLKGSGMNLELSILEKRSVMTVNGKEVDHFAPGARLKLEPVP